MSGAEMEWSEPQIGWARVERELEKHRAGLGCRRNGF